MKKTLSLDANIALAVDMFILQEKAMTGKAKDFSDMVDRGLELLLKSMGARTRITAGEVQAMTRPKGRASGTGRAGNAGEESALDARSHQKSSYSPKRAA